MFFTQRESGSQEIEECLCEVGKLQFVNSLGMQFKNKISRQYRRYGMWNYFVSASKLCNAKIDFTLNSFSLTIPLTSSKNISLGTTAN